MADDAQTVITLLTWTGTPPTATPVSFYATKDAAGNYTLQSTPRVMGAQVDAGNPMPVADAAAETALAAIEASTAQGATAAGQTALLTDLAAILTKLQGTLTAALAAGTNTIGAVIQAGSTGTDYSGGSASGGTGAGTASAIPVSGYVLLTTIPATPTRTYTEVQNQSAGPIQVVRDDGAGNNQTTILLASGGSAGTQGAGWTSATFKGRIRVYGATGAQVAAYQE